MLVQGIVGCTPTNVPPMGNPYISPIYWVFMGYNPICGGFKPFETYDRQIGSSPQVGVKITNV